MQAYLKQVLDNAGGHLRSEVEGEIYMNFKMMSEMDLVFLFQLSKEDTYR
jgi:hypothetical protein